MDKYREFSNLLMQSRYAVAFTGAGISVESGIPDFRSKEGLWARYDPFEYGHIDSFRANPAKVWKLLMEMGALADRANPNQAHIALGELERLGIIKVVITQNVDSLHQRGGSCNVVEFHGNFRQMHCDDCLKPFLRQDVSLETLPPLCTCGGPIRPDVVLFGEGIPLEAYARAFEAARTCDLMLVVGTSASVAPASELPLVARRNGAHILEINPAASEMSHWLTELHIMEPAAAALQNIVEIVKSMQPKDKN
ncbi:MAG TPA: NAD-dependent deacylase [Syntrophobacteraceae bacterium]|nr:NAD-dependent deacylase [Syntrophobacteraceae bacterium]